MTDDTDHLQATVNQRLRALGSSLHVDLPGYTWHIESAKSIHYDVSCLLVAENSTHEDGAVLTIERSVEGARWKIDAVGAEGVWLGDARDIPDRLNDLMSSDAETLDWVVGQVVRSLIDRMIDHLTEPPGGVERIDSRTTPAAT